jgi:nitrogen fixation/metabolism regulation signal transduction histidine kinase
MAHDLKNPLTAMRLSLARMARGGDLPADRAGELTEVLGKEIGVLMRMTESFSEFARLPPPTVRPLDLRALIGDVCALYATSGPVGIELAPGDGVEIRGDADQLRRAFGNLIKNGLEASQSGGGPVRLEIAARAAAITVTVTDAGAGIAEPLEGRRLMTSLGTTKPGGSGLGLPAASKIVHDHGGSLRLEPAGGQGTRAVVSLPVPR